MGPLHGRAAACRRITLLHERWRTHALIPAPPDSGPHASVAEPFLAMHRPHVRHMLSKYLVGRMQPPAQPPTPGRAAYRRLHSQLAAAGVLSLEDAGAAYACDAARIAALFAAACWCAAHAWVVPAALCIAVFWQQVRDAQLARQSHPFLHAGVVPCFGVVAAFVWS